MSKRRDDIVKQACYLLAEACRLYAVETVDDRLNATEGGAKETHDMIVNNWIATCGHPPTRKELIMAEMDAMIESHDVRAELLRNVFKVEDTLATMI